MPGLWPIVVDPPSHMVCPSSITPSDVIQGLDLDLAWDHGFPQFPGKTAISPHVPGRFHVEPPG